MSEFVNISFPPSEQAKFKRWTEKLSRQNRIELQTLVVKTAYDIDRRAKTFAPVNTGFLKGHIRPKIDSDRLGASVGSTVKYAPYVEFGTGNMVVAPADVAEYAMTFKGKGIRKVNQRAQPYLFPAYRMGVKEMTNKLNKMGFK